MISYCRCFSLGSKFLKGLLQERTDYNSRAAEDIKLGEVDELLA